MSSTIQFLVFLVLGGIPVVRLISAFKQCTKLSEYFALEWRQEYETRLCGEILANRANLAEAVDFISDLNADLSPMARDVARALTEQLAASYPSSLQQNPESCQTSESALIAAVLHKEHHPGQPKHWPNWRVRITDLHSGIRHATR